MSKESVIKQLKRLYHDINEDALYSKKEAIFNVTNKSNFAMTEIEEPNGRMSFEQLVRNLYIILYEASGDAKRLPLTIDESGIIQKIKDLRNNFLHDQEQGEAKKIRKKIENINEIYKFLIEKSFPTNDDDWVHAGYNLIEKTIIPQRIKAVFSNPSNRKTGFFQSF
ncbi:MAG: hypothetical protein ACQCN6_08845 [Candidatus Bathyarchaeia archaeon]